VESRLPWGILREKRQEGHLGSIFPSSGDRVYKRTDKLETASKSDVESELASEKQEEEELEGVGKAGVQREGGELVL
jgi:hypothetical protein